MIAESGVERLETSPGHWQVRRLRDSVEGCFNGIWGEEPNGHDDIVCVRVADFIRSRLRVSVAEPTFRAVRLEDRRHRLLGPGDLLLEKSGGGDLQPVGVVMLFDHDLPAVCSNFVARMPVAAGFDSGFLTYLHSHLYAIGLNRRSIKQSIGIQNLDSAAYLSEHVAYPPLEEQRAIARFLDHADRGFRRAISAKQKLIALLDEQKQVVIHRAVTRGLDPNVQRKPSGVEWLGDVPEHWEVRRLGFLLRERGEINRDGAVTQVLSLLRGRGVIPYEEKGNIGNKKSDDITRYKIVRTDDIVVNCMNVIIGSVGLSSRIGCLSPVYYVLERRFSLDDPRYLNAVFQSRPFQRSLTKIGRGILAHRMRIPMELLKSELLPRPPAEEQRRIIEAIGDVQNASNAGIDRAEREIALVREYRQRLIADVVTGKRDVREAAARLPEEVDKLESLAEFDVAQADVPEAEDLEADEA